MWKTSWQDSIFASCGLVLTTANVSVTGGRMRGGGTLASRAWDFLGQMLKSFWNLKRVVSGGEGRDAGSLKPSTQSPKFFWPKMWWKDREPVLPTGHIPQGRGGVWTAEIQMTRILAICSDCVSLPGIALMFVRFSPSGWLNSWY